MNEDDSSIELVNGVDTVNNVDVNNIDNGNSSSVIVNGDGFINKNISTNGPNNNVVMPNVISESMNVNSSLNSIDNSNSSIIKEVSYPDVEEGSKELIVDSTVENNDGVVDSETVIDADVNVSVEVNIDDVLVGGIQEVSVNADSVAFNTLLDNEVSQDSVFNKNNEVRKVRGMKEGQENDVEQKGFPVFMVIVFVLLIIGAFFIDKIALFANNFFSKKEVVEESSKKDEEIEEEKKDDSKNEEIKEIDFSKFTLNDLDKEMKKQFSNYQIPNYVFSTVVEKNKYIINCVWAGEYDSDYKLVVELDYKDGVLSSAISATGINSTDLINWKSTLLYVLRSVSTLHGYKDEEINNAISMINHIELCLEKDGMDLFLKENDSYAFRISLNKKIILPSFKDYSLSESDFKYYLNDLKDSSGNVSFGKGYMYFCYSGKDSVYYFFEKKKSTDNTYNSIVNFLNVYYDYDMSSEYLKLSDAIVRDFVIDVDYKLENGESIYSTDVTGDELRRDYSVVKITFNNSKG